MAYILNGWVWKDRAEYDEFVEGMFALATKRAPIVAAELKQRYEREQMKQLPPVEEWVWDVMCQHNRYLDIIEREGWLDYAG